MLASDDMILHLSVLRELQKYREATLTLYFIFHREKAYKKQLWLALGSSQKAIDCGLDFLMKMRLITTKPADEPFIENYYLLTPSGRVLAKALDEYMDVIMEVWKTIPNHQKRTQPLR